jgi:lysophospholipase
MPIIVACGRAPGELLVPKNTTVFEFGPWEMGSWDPTMFGMAPMKYVGSSFENGKVINDECVTGFDNAAFIMGTSSTLFNAVVAALYHVKFKGILEKISEWIVEFARKLDHADDDIAQWSPNPFKGWHTNRHSQYTGADLGLVDGGEDDQNIPLYPHIQPARKVDVIFAVDSSADSGEMDGWPNGTALIATYQRHLDPDMANGTVFPAIPDINTFTNLGFNERPTFFGCDAKNMSGPSPIIVYIPNAPYTFYTNISTKTTTLPNKERDAVIRNGYHIGTMGNGTIEEEWPACVSCAILSRSFDRTGTKVPDICTQCFQKHCWNGTLASNTPPKYMPQLLMAKYAERNVTSKRDHNRKNSGASSKGAIDSLTLVIGLVMALLMCL